MSLKVFLLLTKPSRIGYGEIGPIQRAKTAPLIKEGGEIYLTNLGVTITTVVSDALSRLASYLPQFLGGLIVLIVGLIIATLLKEVVYTVFKWLRVETWFEGLGSWIRSAKVGKEGRVSVWSDVLAELVRWTVIILFLIPAVEAWGLPRVTDVLNQVLLYLPNVFVAVVVGYVGLAVANLVYDVVKNVTHGMGSSSSNLLANVARYSLVFFTALVVLNQLGVASDLVRILFTGIVVMIALAGGIAFGLGGQETAKRTLKEFQDRLSEVEVTNTVRVRRTRRDR